MKDSYVSTAMTATLSGERDGRQGREQPGRARGRMLVAATGVAFGLRDEGVAGFAPVVATLALAYFKGQLVLLDFMALRHAPEALPEDRQRLAGRRLGRNSRRALGGRGAPAPSARRLSSHTPLRDVSNPVWRSNR
jgi:hypothetical protein